MRIMFHYRDGAGHGDGAVRLPQADEVAAHGDKRDDAADDEAGLDALRFRFVRHDQGAAARATVAAHFL